MVSMFFIEFFPGLHFIKQKQNLNIAKTINCYPVIIKIKRKRVRELVKLPTETGWVEFKCNNKEPQLIGEYISALSNSAALCSRTKGYLVWGLQDDAHEIIGTEFQYRKMKSAGGFGRMLRIPWHSVPYTGGEAAAQMQNA